MPGVTPLSSTAMAVQNSIKNPAKTIHDEAHHGITETAYGTKVYIHVDVGVLRTLEYFKSIIKQ